MTRHAARAAQLCVKPIPIITEPHAICDRIHQYTVEVSHHSLGTYTKSGKEDSRADFAGQDGGRRLENNVGGEEDQRDDGLYDTCSQNPVADDDQIVVEGLDGLRISSQCSNPAPRSCLQSQRCSSWNDPLRTRST